RGDAPHPEGLARPLRGLLRGQLRLRPLPRPAAPASRASPGGPPRPIAVDLPIEEQERPQRRGAAGEAPVSGRDADGACAVAGGPNLAGANQLPQSGNRQADTSQEYGPSAPSQRGGRPPEATWLVDQEGLGLAPPTDPAHGVAAIASGSAPRRNRDTHPPGAAYRTPVESPGAANIRRRSTAQHPRSGGPHGRSGGRLVDDPHRFRNAKAVG